jgi:hypothetical protein
MNIVVSQPMFFPWVGMFEQVRLADIFVNYDDVQFSRGSFTNRVQIKTAHGVKWLTVPLKEQRLGQCINEVKIDSSKNWQRRHLDQLAQAYQLAPFCEDMLALVDAVYQGSYSTIGQLAYASMMKCCSYYGLDDGRRFVEVGELGVHGTSSLRVRDIVIALKGSCYVTGLGARGYLDHGMFEESNIRVEYMNYKRIPYQQLHGSFTPYVSLLDLIANAGPRGIDCISSQSIHWKEFLSNV